MGEPMARLMESVEARLQGIEDFAPEPEDRYVQGRREAFQIVLETIQQVCVPEPAEAPPAEPERLDVATLERFMSLRNLARQHGAVVNIGENDSSLFTEGYCYAIAEVLDILEGRFIVPPVVDPETSR